jgi:hypothetical protein
VGGKGTLKKMRAEHKYPSAQVKVALERLSGCAGLRCKRIHLHDVCWSPFQACCSCIVVIQTLPAGTFTDEERPAIPCEGQYTYWDEDTFIPMVRCRK